MKNVMQEVFMRFYCQAWSDVKHSGPLVRSWQTIRRDDANRMRRQVLTRLTELTRGLL